MSDSPTQPAEALGEASPRSLAKLFAEDPLNLTQDDLEEMCKYLRRDREAFAAQEAKTQAEGKKTTTRRPKLDLDAVLGAGGLDLEL